MSWQRSQGSVSYLAVAEDVTGRQWSCNTSSTSCQIAGLTCGQRYHVHVVGVDEKCVGAKSNIEEIQTGERASVSIFTTRCHCTFRIQQSSVVF